MGQNRSLIAKLAIPRFLNASLLVSKFKDKVLAKTIWRFLISIKESVERSCLKLLLLLETLSKPKKEA